MNDFAHGTSLITQLLCSISFCILAEYVGLQEVVSVFLERKLEITEQSLREKCPYSEFFRSVFSRIRTEYGDKLRIQSKCGKIQTRKTPNMDTFYAVNEALDFHKFWFDHFLIA